ncbi:MAG: phosphoribosylformylglycinamidine synthase subunit PurS [Leptospiraceae bacterium]|nr:phosphoribosylformylglycinamidine synthase subunit PurS [Leptospiraceae bacterium]MCK6380501.1 phosphoribosylformylglycinamidine synthase subunit PurS [Leptospiraceae bacterium]NUM42196.1 phosphoribosylformylglycinamidine synthase subunit PurS [Leptospiraceae bacterium]
MFIGKINITLKESVLDPQGTTVHRTLNEMGEGSVKGVRIGKYIELKLDSTNKDTAIEDLKRICDKLLVNSVIESYTFELSQI